MSDSHSTVRFCPRCQAETERYANGNCKPCARKNALDWYLAHPEHSKATRVANTERTKATKAAWYTANHKKVRALAATWAKANLEARRVVNQNRRAKKLENGGVLSKGLTEKLFKLQRGKCACCGLPLGKDYHLDHKMPVALGGPNIDDNMQLLRKRCNLQKCSQHPAEFMRSRGFLL